MADRVSIIRVADAALLRLTADVDRHPELRARIEAALGVSLPVAGCPSGTDPVLIWQGPSDVLAYGTAAGVAGMEAALRRATEGWPVLIGDASAGLALFDLRGPDIASRITEWMFGAVTAVRKLASLRVTLLAETEPQPRIRLFVDRSYADYLEQWLSATLR